VATVPTYYVTWENSKAGTDGWNTVLFWSGWAMVSWARLYRIDDVSIQTWFTFFGSLVRKNLKVKRAKLGEIWDG
jgi:hypothetical protein